MLIILFSACVAGYQAIEGPFDPRPVEVLWAVSVASLVGFAGNEAVTVFRIRVGREIGSAALVADGYHVRTDGWTSLAVLLGALVVWLDYPLADPVVGLLIAFAILIVVWQSGKSVFARLLDGVDSKVLEEIRHAASHVEAWRRWGRCERAGSVTGCARRSTSPWTLTSRSPKDTPPPGRSNTASCTSCAIST